MQWFKFNSPDCREKLFYVSLTCTDFISVALSKTNKKLAAKGGTNDKMKTVVALQKSDFLMVRSQLLKLQITILLSAGVLTAEITILI